MDGTPCQNQAGSCPANHHPPPAAASSPPLAAAAAGGDPLAAPDAAAGASVLPEVHLQPVASPVATFLPYDGREDHIDLDAPYQRGSVWTGDQRRNLIRSLLMGIPTGTVIVAEQPIAVTRFKRVLDGKQRIEAVRVFAAGELEVPGMWFAADDLAAGTDRSGDITFPDLSDRGRRHFEHRPFPHLVFQSHTETTADPATGRYRHRTRSPEEALAAEAQVYELINFGGVAHTDEDRARAAAAATA